MKNNTVNGFITGHLHAFQDRTEKFIGGLFYLLLLLLPFERMMQHDGKGMLLYMVILVAVASIARLGCFYSAKWSVPLVLYFCFIFIGTISDFSYFYSYGLGVFSWAACRSWVTFFMLIFAHNMVYRNPATAKRIIGILIFDACLIAIFQILGIAQVDEGYAGEGVRQATLGDNVNASARFISLELLFVALVLLKAIRIKIKYRILLLASSAFCFFALLRTGSRGGLISLMAALLASIVAMKKISKKIIFIIILTLFGIGVLFYVLHDDMFLSRFESVYYKGEVGGRDTFLETSYYMIAQSAEAKAIGFGCIAHSLVLGDAFGLLSRATHNTYMYGYMAAGLFGGTCYCLFLLITTWFSYKRRHEEYWNFLFLVMVMMLVGGLVMNIEMIKWFFVICGVISGAYIREKESGCR